jgi:hypothetical protein
MPVGTPIIRPRLDPFAAAPAAGGAAAPAPAAVSPATARAVGAAAAPLDESHFAEIRQAVVSRKAVRAAARTALGSAVTTLFIGASALPFTLIWPSASSLMVTAGICAVGVVEFYGYRRMRRAEPSAAAYLAKNQLAFLGLILFYCLVQAATFTTEDAKAAAISPEARAQLAAMPDMARSIDGLIDRWAPLLTYGFYSLVAVLSICCQGGMALYYFTRRRHIEAFNRRTPAWIRRLFVEMRA